MRLGGEAALGLARAGKPPKDRPLGSQVRWASRGALMSLVCPALNVKLIKEATELINIPQIGF